MMRCLTCIKFAVHTLASALPRSIHAWKDEWPVIVFTDGACEAEGALVTHGAVLCDITSGSYLFFGDHVPKNYVEAWMESGKKQVICQAELFPIWIAKVTWRSLLSGRQVLWFCDNEAARSAVVRSYSLCLIVCRLCVSAHSKMWQHSRQTGMPEFRQSPILQMPLHDLTSAAMHSWGSQR